MFSKLIRALLGAFGIIEKTKKFTKENNAEFMRSLEPGTIVLTHRKGFIQGGIQGATDSFWCHALIYVGKSTANIVRQVTPSLIHLPEGKLHETVEAQGEGIVISTLEASMTDDDQLVSYTYKLSTLQTIKLLAWLYAQVGKPYGYLTFITELFPNPSDIPVWDPGWICSGLTAVAYKRIDIQTVKKGITPSYATPKDLNDYLEPNLSWSMSKFNW